MSDFEAIIIRDPVENDRSMRFNTRGHQEVEIASQITPVLVISFSQEVNGEVALTSPVSVGDKIINVDSVTSVSVGNHLVLTNAANVTFFVGKILSIATLAVTVDTPASNAFPVSGSVVTFTSTDMSVDGSSTSVVFGLRTGEPNSAPLTNLTADINRILMTATCDSAVSLAKFGDLAALTNGCVLRVNNGDGTYHNIHNVKTNLDLAKIAFDFKEYLGTSPQQNVDGFSWRLTFGGESKIGTVVRLNSTQDLEWVVQDNLTGLTTLDSVGEGAPVAD